MPIAKNRMNEALFEETLTKTGVDAVVCLHPKNLFYSTGYPLALSYTIHQRPGSPRSGIAVFTPGASPTLLVGGNEVRVTRETTWVEDVRVYTEYVDSPIALLATVLTEKGIASGKVGLEKEYFCAAFYDELKSLLPQVTLVPWDAHWDAVRSIKTPAEVELMKRNADLMDEAFRETFESITVGDTEKEIQDRLIYALLRRGATTANGILQAGQENFVIHRWSNNPIQPGDVICTDFLASFDGYYSNLSRIAVVGEPTSEQKQVYTTIRDIHRQTAETLLRPGTPANAVFFHVKEAQEKKGLYHHRALVGHNMGVWVHEDPMLVAGDSRPLAKGMVVVLEPRFYAYQMQDAFLISDGAPLLLSDTFDTDQMYVVG
jgi:Xaa-Pro aminopeptidase